jgi:hypothetical protein
VVIDPALLAAPDSSAATAEKVPPAPRTSRGREPAPVDHPPGPGSRDPYPITTEDRRTAAGSSLVDSVRAAEARAALISIDLDPSDRARLSWAAKKNLSAADSLAKLAGARPLSPQNREKLATAQGLMRQAREAVERGDIHAAANLSYKARLLAAEARQ